MDGLGLVAPRVASCKVGLQDDLLLHFAAGDESRFFLTWSSHLNPAILSSSKDLLAEATDLELELRVHFAVHPQRCDSTDKLRCEEAMLRFRTFLESRGSAMSESSPHLHYYALPYVSKLREHQTFGRIFNEEWLETLRKRLESFIDDAFHLVELNTAKTKPSRLSYLYHCADIELNGNYQVMGPVTYIRAEMSILERRLAEALAQNSLTTRQLLRLEEEHQRLMSVTGELISALESAIQGRTVDMANILDYCGREVPTLLTQISNRTGVGNKFGLDFTDEIKAIDITETEDKPPLRLVAYELNYQLIKNELLRGDMDTKCRLIQALRWQLTKCRSPERRHSTLMAFISHDLLGCFKRQSEYATRLLHLLRSPSSKLQQGLCRLLNAFASFRKGRAYLARNTQLVVVMADALVHEQLDNTARDMIIASLQKLSLRRPLVIIMVDSGTMGWLLRTLPEGQSCDVNSEVRGKGLGPYGFEYAAALFMNLCLSPHGRQECAKQPDVTLDVIMDLYDRNLPEILMYLNGALYSLISNSTLLQEAKARIFSEKLRKIQQGSSDEISHQIGCILEKLENADSAEDTKEKDSGDEKNMLEEDETAVQDDEVETEIDQGEPSSRGDAHSGETLLWKLYTLPGAKLNVAHIPDGQRRSISTGSRSRGRRQAQAANPMPHDGGDERKSRLSGRESSSPPEFPAILKFMAHSTGDRSPLNVAPSASTVNVLHVAPAARSIPTTATVADNITCPTLGGSPSETGPEHVCLPEILNSPQALESLQPEAVFAARPKVPRTPENSRR
ncbi:lisH domain-containing protein ARMC9-like [Varroa destructor]|uniref:LisH domain-containing protein ARMC9 n=1 Tax=Varroa destructor TaxID=109461 RepID=A0A7M7K900_VARDE|nr:lisH domain-containing protein ARMC9-like [Varroa destructor]